MRRYFTQYGRFLATLAHLRDMGEIRLVPWVRFTPLSLCNFCKHRGGLERNQLMEMTGHDDKT